MSVLFEDIFEIKNMDPEGKKFDKVSRIEAQSENYEMQLVLDVNSDIYPVEIGEKFTMALASTLSADGEQDEEVIYQSNRPSLADKYEYVMYGKVFKYVEDKNPATKVSVYVSYGGLLMMLNGDPRNLQGVELDARIYLLIRKV
ncbi:DNA-directed RNA polymerases I, II, and III subunit RPABC3 [Balamuthia mandrillaris]